MNDTLAPTTSPVLTVEIFEAGHLGAARAIVDQINARAARKGMDQRLDMVWSRWTATLRSEVLGVPTTVPMITFVVLGTAPVFSGWTFVATLTWDEEAGCITRVVPGSPDIDLSAHRAAPKHCDHCGLNRDRIDTLVLVNEEGVQKQVGRSCVRDFIGLDPSTALWLLKIEKSFREGDDEGGMFSFTDQSPRRPVVDVLGVASAVIALHGWAPRSSGFGNTADRVERFFFPPIMGEQVESAKAANAEISAHLAGDNQAAARAVATREWVAASTEPGEFMTNLRAVCGAETVDMVRNLGLAVSAVSAWGRAVDREVEQAARATQTSSSVHVGAVKERLHNLELTVHQSPRFFESDWGTSTLLTFVDAAGNVLKWFASGTRDTLAVGDTVTLTGTVKSHEEWQGVAQTMLTRCVLS